MAVKALLGTLLVVLSSPPQIQFTTILEFIFFLRCIYRVDDHPQQARHCKDLWTLFHGFHVFSYGSAD
ncbi:PREDICTED: PRUPE_1G297700, partial [Prunus dulcis]